MRLHWKWLILAVLLAGRVCAAGLDAARLAAMDAHALAAPPDAAASVTTLAAYLARPARTDAEKARAIYRWLAEQITYDVPAFLGRAARATAPEDVLRTRTAVCSGYANLCEALGRAAGLEVVTVTGFAKGIGYGVGETVDAQPNHAWNAVRIDGTWRLLDATWGSGHLDGRMRFVRRFNPHYFLTPPEQFIVDHLPADPRWQLLDPPVSREAFARFVLLRPAFFLHGLALDSHRDGVIRAADTARVTLAAPAETQVIAQLLQDERILPSTLTLVQREGDRCAAAAVFPRAGAYVLRLFAKSAGEAGPYAWVLDYRIDATAGAGERAGFPAVAGSFIEAGARLHAPLGQILPAGQAVRFALTVPNATAVSVISGGRWTPLALQDGRFTGEVRIAPGPVQVVASLPGAEPGTFPVLLTYRGE